MGTDRPPVPAGVTDPAAPGAAAPASPTRLAAWAGRLPFALLVLAGALIARAPGFSRGLFDPDEAAIATMGMVVSRGGVLYRDVIDRKPPVAPLIYALSFVVTGSRHLEPLHVLAALELAGAAWLVAAEVRRTAGTRAAWWAAALMIAGAVALRPADAQAVNYSHLALLPGVGAIVAARRGTPRSAVLAGVLLGLAVLTRQTWIIGLVPAGVAVWMFGGRRLGSVAGLVAATLATVAAIAVVVPFGPFVHWTFSGNGSVLFGSVQDPLGRGFRALEVFAVGHLALVALLGWRALTRRPRGDLDLWLWLIAGLVAFVAGFRYFGHYWLQVLPPLCLLAAPAVVSWRRWAQAALVILLLGPTIAFWAQAWTPIHGRSNIDVRAFALVAEVRRQTRPGDLITVWGSFPEIYWLSGREPAGALVISDFLVGRTAGRPDGPQRLQDATPGAESDFLASLRAHPPVLFLDTSPGAVRKYQHYPLSLLPALARFVHDRYHRIATVDGVAIYQRNGYRPPT